MSEVTRAVTRGSSSHLLASMSVCAPFGALSDMLAQTFRHLGAIVAPYTVVSNCGSQFRKAVVKPDRLTDWANTRCKNTCMTIGGFGKTAFTI
jgi:hypothetical protein